MLAPESRLKIQHKNRAIVTTQVGRYSTFMVSTFLSIDDSKVRKWIQYGWLKARRHTLAMGYWVINDEDLRFFLRTYGAILDLHPVDPEWARTCAESRQSFLHDYISQSDIAKLLCVVPKHIVNGKKGLVIKYGFPAPAYVIRLKGGGVYFAKRAIITWLRANPRYDPQGKVRRVLY